MTSGNGDARKKANGAPKEKPTSAIETFKDAPPTIDRPLTIVDGHAYAVTTGWTPGAGRGSIKTVVVLRDDRQIFGIDDKVRLPPLNDLGIVFELGSSLPDRGCLSRREDGDRQHWCDPV